MMKDITEVECILMVGHRHSKSRFFVRSQNFSFEILGKKSAKISQKNHNINNIFSLRIQIPRFCTKSEFFLRGCTTVRL